MNKNARVSVLSADGLPLMPTKFYRAKSWVERGEAEWVSTDIQIKTVQLRRPPSGTDTQSIVIGIDPGKLYSGIGVVSQQFTLLRGHLNLPFKRVKARKEAQRILRRARRGRRINRKVAFHLRAHRQKRFDNRRSSKVPPSIRANRQLELRVVKELCRLFPVSKIVYEYVEARGSKSFSPVMVGQRWAIEQLSQLAPVTTLLGWQTAQIRHHLGLFKSKEKSLQTPESHAVDGVALAASEFVGYEPVQTNTGHGHQWLGEVRLTVSAFRVFSRPELYRRQLHFEKPGKGGERKRKGGTITPFGFRSGDYVEAVKAGVTYRGWIGGFTNSGKSQNLSVYSAAWKRVGQFTVGKVSLIQRSNGLCVA